MSAPNSLQNLTLEYEYAESDADFRALMALVRRMKKVAK